MTRLVPATQCNSARVLVIEPNATLRSALLTLLQASNFEVQACSCLEDVLQRANGDAGSVALVAWQSMQGLLAEEQRDHLRQVSSRVRLVVMVPRHWARLLDQTDLASAVTGIIAKPFEADELLETLSRALASQSELASRN